MLSAAGTATVAGAPAVASVDMPLCDARSVASRYPAVASASLSVALLAADSETGFGA
eukprot:NODE_7852_length_416_cov_284.518006.p5 GENE.NODE_7852_length_416_cov_284.518006~~NODE_7852_length_416_cov_284.518006.p5  ORF type:complete len:57 (-),score=9.37 NODE_7852_length_416_cov_284.518006:164-334(-)